MRIKLFYGSISGATLLENAINIFCENKNVVSITMAMDGTSIISTVVYSKEALTVEAPKRARPSRAKKN